MLEKINETSKRLNGENGQEGEILERFFREKENKQMIS